MPVTSPASRTGRPVRRRTFLALLGGLGFSAASVFAQEPAVMPLDQVESGQRAVARTVFQGTTIEEFDVEIVSVVHDVGPDQDLILARAQGDRMEHLGVAQGMSGSPVYIDGKLIGAVSSTWSFTKEPLFGITPVEQMAREGKRSFEGSESAVPPSSGPPSTSHPPAGRAFLEGEPPATRDRAGFAPIGTPLVLAGFDPRVVDLAAKWFEPWGFTVAEGGSAGDTEKGGAMEPGAMIGVRLAGGDANMTGLGTVTWVEGDRVHAWGHPFFQIGQVEMPLVSGYVHAIVPSNALSFKLGSGAEIVGTATGDRRSGIFGRLGVEPRLTQFDLEVVRGEDTETFRFELVRDRYLTPALVGVTAVNAILSQSGQISEETVRYHQRLVLDDGRETTVETLMSGDRTLEQVANLLSEATKAIALNPFEDVRFEKIEARIEYTPGVRIGFLTEMSVENQVLEPGDDLRGSYVIRDYRGGEARHRFRVPLREDAREGRYLLLVSDANTAEQFESERDPRSFAPRDLDEYLERIRRLRQTDEVHIHLYRQSHGVLIEGRPLADLPPSALAVIHGASRSGVKEELPAEIVFEERVSAGRFVQGGHTLLLEVKKEKP